MNNFTDAFGTILLVTEIGKHLYRLKCFNFLMQEFAGVGLA